MTTVDATFITADGLRAPGVVELAHGRLPKEWSRVCRSPISSSAYPTTMPPDDCYTVRIYELRLKRSGGRWGWGPEYHEVLT